MLEQAFNEVYTKFKLHFYGNSSVLPPGEATLTTVECMEGIGGYGGTRPLRLPPDAHLHPQRGRLVNRSL